MLNHKTGIRIGFDIDGVLADTKGSSWALRIKDTNMALLYCCEAKLLLNPRLFLHENDSMFIITARSREFAGITQKWCKHFFPGVPIFYVRVKIYTNSDEWEEWFNKVAQAKADTINKLKLDVYFEDQPKTVTKLRELCRNTIIIQYGGNL